MTPATSFNFGDFGARAIIGDEAFLDAEEPEDDKIALRDIGFAYDLSGFKADDPNSPIIRRACAFYGDLAKLTSVHQQRWKTYQVDEGADLRAHPIWMGQQMNRWPDGYGPFGLIFLELRQLNELHVRAFGASLFRVVQRPDSLGWLLRPSQREWDAFVQQLDKVLSENLDHEGLDLLGVPRRDDSGQNIGSLNRLGRFLESCNVPSATVKDVLKPLRDVRQARQRPAHSLRVNITDKTYIHRQVILLERVGDSLQQLRYFWQQHPDNASWVPEQHHGDQRYRM